MPDKPGNVLALARQDLACFAMAMWPSFEYANHHRLIIEKLEAVERGDIKRLMITMPPRHGKSLLATQLFPAYYLGRHPDRSVITATYGQDLADDFGRKVRNFLVSSRYHAIFPECVISADSSSMRRFDTDRGGSYYAVGRGGAITGRGVSGILLIDDPLKDREEARSDGIRNGLHSWFSSVAYTRLQPGAAIILIQTRWHSDDLIGRQLREHPEENWDELNLPAIAEKDEGFRREGEALWPERFPLPVLESIRAAIGGADWASLYQQRPAAAEGAIFKRDWWRTYQQPPQFKRVIQSWDTAFKAGAENDYSVCTTWGDAPTGFYLLGLWRKRVEFPELKRMVAQLGEQWNPNVILIEDKASGQSLIQEIKLATRLAVKPVKVDSDKVARAEAVTPMIEAGRVFLPEGAPWLSDYLDELSTFPAGAHDDAVDSTTQALNYLRGAREPNILTYYKSLAQEQQTAIYGAVVEAAGKGSQIECNPAQFPEIRKALAEAAEKWSAAGDARADYARRELARLDVIFVSRPRLQSPMVQ